MKITNNPQTQRAKCKLCGAEYEIDYTDYFNKKIVRYDCFGNAHFVCAWCKTVNVEVLDD